MKASAWWRIHPFNIIAALFLLFIVLRVCLHQEVLPLLESSKDRFSESLRTTQSPIGIMIRPIPSVVDEIQMVVENLNVETSKKIRVGNKDRTNPRMPIEILAVSYGKPFLKTKKPKNSFLQKEPSVEPQKVLLRLRIPTFIYLDSEVSARRLLSYKGKPIIGDRTYTFTGPGYSVSGPIVPVGDFIAGGYRPKLYRIEIIGKTQPFKTQPLVQGEIQRIYPGQRVKTPNLSKQLGTYVVIKKVFRIPQPGRAETETSDGTYQLKILMECYCYKAKNGFKFDASLSPIKAGELSVFNVGGRKMDLKINRLRMLPDKKPTKSIS